jgi:L-seryl-tRNA(Ser) seleniumtransferase
MPDYRVIPSIERLRQRPALRELEASYGHEAVVEALREEVDALRRQLERAAEAGDDDARAAAGLDDAAAIAAAIDLRAAVRLRHRFAPSLRPVVNATGVVIHTNLGRAPLAAAALARIAEVAGGYSNLEYDLDRGERGARDGHGARPRAGSRGSPAPPTPWP